MRMEEQTERVKQGRCWDCGKVPTDEKDRQTVKLGLNCQACFDRGTEELLELMAATENDLDHCLPCIEQGHFWTLPIGPGWEIEPGL